MDLVAAWPVLDLVALCVGYVGLCGLLFVLCLLFINAIIQFLQERNIMDYSFFIGIHKVSENSANLQ